MEIFFLLGVCDAHWGATWTHVRHMYMRKGPSKINLQLSGRWGGRLSVLPDLSEKRLLGPVQGTAATLKRCARDLSVGLMKRCC